MDDLHSYLNACFWLWSMCMSTVTELPWCPFWRQVTSCSCWCWILVLRSPGWLVNAWASQQSSLEEHHSYSSYTISVWTRTWFHWHQYKFHGPTGWGSTFKIWAWAVSGRTHPHLEPIFCQVLSVHDLIQGLRLGKHGNGSDTGNKLDSKHSARCHTSHCCTSCAFKPSIHQDSQGPTEQDKHPQHCDHRAQQPPSPSNVLWFP